jgi:hypothetical protein
MPQESRQSDMITASVCRDERSSTAGLGAFFFNSLAFSFMRVNSGVNPTVFSLQKSADNSPMI